MSQVPQRYIIRRKEQLRVLAAAARQEVADVLAQMGTASVAEIAATLGRPADGLYFHLRALKRVGLAKQVGYRSRGGRKEALFRTVAPDLRLHYEPKDDANRTAVAAIVRSMLRLGIRDFQRSFDRGDVLVSGPHRELWATRTTGRLSLTQIAGLNRSIENVKRAVYKSRKGGRLYGITILLTPLDHRARKTSKALSSGSSKANTKTRKART